MLQRNDASLAGSGHFVTIGQGRFAINLSMHEGA